MKVDQVFGFMKQQRLMTVSTVHVDGRPQAAVVQFAVLPTGQLVLTTSSTSRKFQNLLRDDRVACVVGWDERITVQLEGKLEVVPEAEIEALKAVYLEQNPKATKLTAQPDMVLLRITPVWLRYADYATNPWLLQEFTADELAPAQQT